MRNYLIYQIILVTFLIICPFLFASGEGEINLKHKIIISKNGDNIDVKENLQIVGEDNDSYDDYQ